MECFALEYLFCLRDDIVLNAVADIIKGRNSQTPPEFPG
jgi:hypothetical protein